MDGVQSLISSQLRLFSAHITCLILLANCESGTDYYCMYYDAIPTTVVDTITPLAPESLKSCTVKNPKIKDIKSEVSNVEDEFNFDIIVEIGVTRERHIEYLIYDTLNLVGTVGGTLGLFVGFSFYDFICMIIDLFFDKLEIDDEISVGGYRNRLGISLLVPPGTTVATRTTNPQNQFLEEGCAISAKRHSP